MNIKYDNVDSDYYKFVVSSWILQQLIYVKILWTDLTDYTHGHDPQIEYIFLELNSES